MDYNGKIAFITGGSSGIGLALARQLAAQGADVWIAARDAQKLESACRHISGARARPDQRIDFLELDVSNRAEVIAKLSAFQREVGVPDMVINSAGVVHPGYFQELELERFEWMMDINYHGTVNVIKAFIQGMIERGSGKIVNISSAGGFLGIIGYTAYSGSKFAVRGFSDALRMEMKPLGIQVSIVFPPDTDTPQLAYEDQFKPPETKIISSSNMKATDADTVAKAVIKGMQKGTYQIFPGRDTKLMYRISRLAGRLTFTILDVLLSDAVRQKEKAKK